MLLRCSDELTETNPKRPPGDVVAKEQLFDVGAVSDQTFEGDGMHRRSVREDHQLRSTTRTGREESQKRKKQQLRDVAHSIFLF